MYPIDAFRPTLEKIRTIFERCSIGYHLTGGVTSISYGEPRMTQDIDIVIENSAVANQLDEFLRSLEDANFLFDPKEVRNSVEKQRLFQLLDMDETLKLDIYPRELVPGELGRSRMFEIIEGMKLPIVSCPDAAVSKLVWISKGSHKSRSDLRHIYGTGTEEDRQLIHSLSTELQLADLLSEVLSESDEIRE